ncbi:hypothetical protein [Streptomyces canus]|uniref:hypothetical protein n=1 Tax=Streptomyces canus TaxID=58343 RepID=UPI002E332EFA|nr:hypothetical protein [Streptomyces canus]
MKDPTVFRYKHRYAPLTFLDTNPNIGDRYAAVPQGFCFARQKLRDMVRQACWRPSHSTAKDPADPGSWRAPRSFFDSEPPVLAENKGSGFRLDFWTICDRSDCSLSFSDGNGCLRLGHSGAYLMLVEALATGSDWRRHLRARTAPPLEQRDLPGRPVRLDQGVQPRRGDP